MEDSRRVEVLEMIATDIKNDAKNLDGLPFNGKTIGKCLGRQGAAITTIAIIMKSILEQTKES